MSTVAEAALALQTALETVPDMRVHIDLGPTVDPPAAAVGPPALTWAGYSAGPNVARFPVWVIVAADDRALEKLWDLVPVVVAALESSTDAEITVTQANPGRYPAGGGTDLPSYEISTEVAL